jgi:penicillin-binding protein 1A
MIFTRNTASILLKLFFTGVAGGILVVAGTLMYLVPGLPSVDQLRDVHLQTPLKVYASTGELIGEFGEQRRSPVSFEQIPDHFINAIISAEDDSFFSHGGVDLKGLLRAASQIVTTGGIQSGGSTITMQVARNFFLSLEQTFTRKFNEILLALEIEHELSKQEILELYANKIYLGKRAYGVQAAANVYYGTDIGDLSLAQLAMIAGLPKAPTSSNPINDPERALIRRDWILGRMLLLGYIDQADHDLAVAEPVTASYHGSTVTLDAPYVAEMVRVEMLDRFGADSYEAGYEVFTTLDPQLQRAADESVSEGVFTYDLRHGYRGAEERLSEVDMSDLFWVQEQINQIPVVSGLVPAVVVEVQERSATVLSSGGTYIELGWNDGLAGTRRYRTESWQGDLPDSADDLLAAGDVIRLRQLDGRWVLSQVPDVQAGMVALEPTNGAIRALTGGFDFYQSRFNRITSAKRQPGSNMKPFLYASALENGYTPATLINDAPIIFEDAALEDFWRPENDSGVFYGPTRLRKALYLSRNLVSIRVLRGLGIDTAREAIIGYGFEDSDLPYNLTLALGSQGLEAIKMAAGYALFANGGFRVEPHIISEIRDRNGETIFTADPPIVCADCNSAATPRSEPQLESSILQEQFDFYAAEEVPNAQNYAEQVMDPRVAYIMDSILRDVIIKGTGTRALVLGREDIAGKTGTTNGPRDSWFSGYSPHLVATAWLGFDDNGVLGVNEFGGTAALPIWINFMQTALEGKSQDLRPQPAGVVRVLIDPETGERAPPGSEGAIFELFLTENVPDLLTQEQLEPREESGNITDALF